MKYITPPPLNMRPTTGWHSESEEWRFREYDEDQRMYMVKVWVRHITASSRFLSEHGFTSGEGWYYYLRDGEDRWVHMPNAHTEEEAKAAALAIWRTS